MTPPALTNLRKTALFVSLGFAALALLFALAGWWMRPMADDYLFKRHLDNYGYLGAEIVWWQTWHGRWASQLLISALFGTGYWFVPVLPLVLTGIWGAGNVLVLRRLKVETPVALALTACALGLTFSLVPDLVDSLFWAAASLFHVLPLALMPVVGLLLLSKSQSPFRLPAVALCSLLLGGMSEVYDVWLVPALFVFALIRRDRYAWTAFIMGTVGSLLLILAPGNFQRASEYPGEMSISRTLIQTFHWSGYLWVQLLQPALAAGAGLAFVLGFTSRRQEQEPSIRPWWPLLPAALGQAATYLCLLPVIHGTKGTAPQLRVYTPPTYLAILGLLATVYMAGMALRQRRPESASQPFSLPVMAPAALAALPLLLLPAFHKGVVLLENMRVFEVAWTARDESLKQQAAAGKKVLYCRRLPLPGMQHDIWPDPTHYVNDIMAYHYTGNWKVRVMMIQDQPDKPQTSTAPRPAQNGTG